MAAAASPLLIDELIEEVLFRIPADDPMTLVLAALVCKRWRRLIHDDPGFHRRLCEFHRAPPMLGVLCNSDYVTYKARFIPTCSFRSPHAITNKMNVADARHGRVLHTACWGNKNKTFAIWDPIKDDTWRLPELPDLPYVGFHYSSVAAVLCAMANGGSCHCQHDGPFRVVFIGTFSNGMFIYVYSSEDGAWSRHRSSQRPDGRFDTLAASLLLGNTLHFMFYNNGAKILKYDLATRAITMTPTPPTSRFHESRVVLTTTEEGELGFGRAEGCLGNLWSKQVTLDEADVGWVKLE